MPLGEGSVLGRRYRLLSQIGRGGMGTVWHAHDDLLARDVAVKEVLFPPGLSDQEHRVLYERTLREARSAARLSHPGIVTVHDVVEEDGRPCIVMEYVRARSLQEVIDREGRLPHIQVAEIGIEVLVALRVAHAAGITHRDVKPANVLLAGDPDEPIFRSTRVVITDFGIATMEGDSTLTQTGLVMGSPAYIAPERASGDRASPASDLWSLGATLYAAVEGRSPHHRSHAMAALSAILSEEAPPPLHAGPLTPVLMGLLEKDPARRMTADEAAEGLIRAANSTRPLPASEPGTTADAAPDRTRRQDDPPRPSLPGPPDARPDQPVEEREGRMPAGPPAAPYASVAAREARGSDAAGSSWPGTPSHDSPAVGRMAPHHAPTPQDEAWKREHARPADAPGDPGPGRPSAARRRAALIAVSGVLAIALIATWVVLRPTHDHTSAGPGTSPGPPSPSPTPSPTIPADFHQVTAQDGSTLAAPKGWTHRMMPVTTGQSEWWIDQRTGNRIQLDTIPWGTPDPVEHWIEWSTEVRKKQTLPGFAWVNKPSDIVQRGWNASDAEYTWYVNWKGSRVKMHAYDRGFVVNGRQYSLMAAVRERNPAGARHYFDAAFEAFQPGSG